jgi:hypothetical protein
MGMIKTFFTKDINWKFWGIVWFLLFIIDFSQFGFYGIISSFISLSIFYFIWWCIIRPIHRSTSRKWLCEKCNERFKTEKEAIEHEKNCNIYNMKVEHKSI